MMRFIKSVFVGALFLATTFPLIAQQPPDGGEVTAQQEASGKEKEAARQGATTTSDDFGLIQQGGNTRDAAVKEILVVLKDFSKKYAQATGQHAENIKKWLNNGGEGRLKSKWPPTRKRAQRHLDAMQAGLEHRRNFIDKFNEEVVAKVHEAKTSMEAIEIAFPYIRGHILEKIIPELNGKFAEMKESMDAMNGGLKLMSWHQGWMEGGVAEELDLRDILTAEKSKYSALDPMAAEFKKLNGEWAGIRDANKILLNAKQAFNIITWDKDNSFEVNVLNEKFNAMNEYVTNYLKILEAYKLAKSYTTLQKSRDKWVAKAEEEKDAHDEVKDSEGNVKKVKRWTPAKLLAKVKGSVFNSGAESKYDSLEGVDNRLSETKEQFSKVHEGLEAMSRESEILNDQGEENPELAKQSAAILGLAGEGSEENEGDNPLLKQFRGHFNGAGYQKVD